VEIVVLAQYAGSPSHGMVYGHYYLAREWVRSGHKVTIVSASFVHTRFKQPEVSGITEEYIDGIRYLWVPTPSYSQNDKVGRVRNILSFSIRCWLGRLPIACADLVICSSHHPFPIYPARQWARRHRARLVFEVRDLWPLSLIELGEVTAKHPFIRLMQWFEDYAYRHADKVVSVLPMACDHMVQHGMNPDKFIFIPNGVCVENEPEPERMSDRHREVLEKARAQGSFIIGFVGRVGLATTLKTLVEAVALSDIGNLCIAILSEKASFDELNVLAKRLGVADCLLLINTIPKAQVADFLSRIDVAYIGLKRKKLFRFGVSPTKVNDYMLAAKPVIYAIDAPRDIVSESCAGISCRAEDPHAVSAAIKELYGLSSEQRAKMGQHGRRWIIENRNYKDLAQRFLDSVCSSDL